MAEPSDTLYDFAPLAADYESWYLTAAGKAHDNAQQAAVLQLLPPANPGTRLLEVGCGTGHWSRFFAELGYEVMGLDRSPEMIEVARSFQTPNCHFEIGNACNLPASIRKYQVVAALATLEFVSDQSAAIAGMARCRDSQGLLLVGTLNALAPLNQKRTAAGKQPYASAHLLTPAELGALLHPYGQVRFAEADPEAEQTRPRWPASWWTARRLRSGRSQAPFIAATARYKPRR